MGNHQVDLLIDHPELDEAELLPLVGRAVDQALGCPISIDSHNPAAIERALDGYPGKPLLNSIAYEPDLLARILTLVAKHKTAVVAMQGRFHLYEGYDLKEVTFPVRVMGLLGAEYLVVSGACGGMNPDWKPGELVLLDDHINLLGDNPLVGPNLDELGPRFPDMSAPYDRELQALAQDVASEEDILLRTGVYVAVQGPNLETRAEYRMLWGMGADVVGMSTVPEVIVATHMGMRVLGVTIITDACLPDELTPVDINEIIETARKAEPSLSTLVRGVVGRLPKP